MTIQMPQIDVQGLLPVAGLVVIALAAVIGIVLWVALRSKVAMVVAVVIGVIASGPMLVQAVGSIVSALVLLVLIVVAGVIGLVVALQRSPAVVDLVRDLRPKYQIEQPPMIIEPHKPLGLPGGQTAKTVTKRMIDQDVLQDWGW